MIVTIELLKEATVCMMMRKRLIFSLDTGT